MNIKYLAWMALLATGGAFANSTITVVNTGLPAYLLESGLTYMVYTPKPLAILNNQAQDNFIATSTLPPNIGIDSVKLVYGSENNTYTPACEFVLQVNRDVRTGSFYVNKLSATPIRYGVGTLANCDSKLTGFSPVTGESNVTFTVRFSKY